MAAPIRLLVGLGNPGETYQLTRHNIGANWLRALALRFGIQLKHDRAKRAEIGRGLLLSHDVRLLIPTTYMNQSGEAIGPFLRYFRIDPDETLLAYDDVAFEVGQTRLKFGGGAGGHNGLRSLIKHIGDNRDFGRLRIGVGHPGSSKDLVGFLTRVKMPEPDRIRALESSYLDDELLRWLFTGDWQKAMTKLNSVPSDDA
ncbi:MAG: aminoacyl-tRNA hydrolase [Gammaproteobacteria bacterium]|nr:aminoacyl-tRNA hydrolase [Gammaproteobacteria bacterium]